MNIENRLLWQERDASLMNLAQQKLGTYTVIYYVHNVSRHFSCRQHAHQSELGRDQNKGNNTD